MTHPTPHLTLAPPIVTVYEAQGRTFISSGPLSIEIPADMVPRVASELLVSMERVSDAADLCGCWNCCEARGEQIWWMIVCSVCGNKRCPHAADHHLDCTASNESGQSGSAYEHGSGAASERRLGAPS